MIVQFEKEYLKELFEKGKTSDKHLRFQPQVIKKYILRVMTLQDAPNIEALYPLNSLPKAQKSSHLERNSSSKKKRYRRVML